MEPLYYDEYNRPVYRNENLPHEEERNVYCPNLCSWSNAMWVHSCIHRPEFDAIKVMGGINFNKLDDREVTCEQIEESARRNLPSYEKVDSSSVSQTYIQLFWYDSICPMNIIRNVIGDSMNDCIQNVYFDKLIDNTGYYCYFECHDLAKGKLIEDNVLKTIDGYTNNEAKTKLKVIYCDNGTDDFGDDFMLFYFEFVDIEFIEGVYKICEEFNMEIAHNPFPQL